MAKKLETIELFIDESQDKDGIDALSLVKFPAIEENWVALNNHRIEFKSVDDEKRIIIGLALVPDKLIYRKNGDYEYNIKFSKDTVNKAARLYLKKLNNNNATLEHKTEVEGVSVVESWTVDNPKMDKTALYDLNAVEGAWAVIMSIDNDKVWEEIKNGTYLGISVEGYFSDKLEMNLNLNKKEMQKNVMIEKIKSLIEKSELKNQKVELGLIDEISKELSIAFNSQDVESEINNAIAKLQKSLPVYKSVVAKCDEALVKIKDLGITGGIDKQVIEQKNEATSSIKSIENRISNLSKLRK